MSQYFSILELRWPSDWVGLSGMKSIVELQMHCWIKPKFEYDFGPNKTMARIWMLSLHLRVPIIQKGVRSNNNKMCGMGIYLIKQGRSSSPVDFKYFVESQKHNRIRFDSNLPCKPRVPLSAYRGKATTKLTKEW